MTNLALPDLAQAIDREHQAAHQAAQTAIEHAIECGRLLLEAKASVGHGGWLPWIDANLSFGERQAQKYIRLHRNAGALPNANSGSDLSINGALEALSEPKQEAIEEGLRLAAAVHNCDGLRQAVKEHVDDIAGMRPAMARVRRAGVATRRHGSRSEAVEVMASPPRAVRSVHLRRDL